MYINTLGSISVAWKEWNGAKILNWKSYSFSPNILALMSMIDIFAYKETYLSLLISLWVGPSNGLFPPPDSDSDSETNTDSCTIQILWERDPNLNLNWWKNLCIVQCNHRERSPSPNPNPSPSPLVELSHQWGREVYHIPFTHACENITFPCGR